MSPCLMKRREQNRQATARWRACNTAEARSRCQEYHATHAEEVRDRKRAYYQNVRKTADATDEGRWKDRHKKARRRAAAKAGSISRSDWDAIVARHGGRCAYCGRDDLPLEQDHVGALSKGGEHSTANVVPACKPCNSRKGAR